MLEIKDNDMIITKEDGNVETFKILFYYNNPERKKDIYFLYKEENPDELIAVSSSDGETLNDLTKDEFEEAEEMLDVYQNDPKIGEIKK